MTKTSAMHELTSAQDAARLLKQACERLAEHLNLVETEPGAGYLLFNSGGAYQVEWSEAWGRLVLTAGLGFPPAGCERAALNLALSYNALWREVGNLRMARGGAGGELMLIGELGAEHAEPQAFNAALMHFEGLRRWWAHALTHAGDELPEPPPLPGPLIERV